MTQPMTKCDICLRSRDPHLHDNGKGELPPVKAEKWLRKTCPHKSRHFADGSSICQIQYRAGIGFQLAKELEG